MQTFGFPCDQCKNPIYSVLFSLIFSLYVVPCCPLMSQSLSLCCACRISPLTPPHWAPPGSGFESELWHPQKLTKYPKPPLSKPHFYFMALKAIKPCTLWTGVQLNTIYILGWWNPEGHPKKDLSAILWAGAAIWWHSTSSAKTKMCLNLSYFPPHPVWLICHYSLVIIRECS